MFFTTKGMIVGGVVAVVVFAFFWNSDTFYKTACMILCLIAIGVLIRATDLQRDKLQALINELRTEQHNQIQIQQEIDDLEVQIMQKLKERQRVAARGLDLPRENVRSLPDVECVVCCTNNPIVVIVPCGHTKSCARCIQLIVDKPEIATCPYCQSVIEDCVRVFG
ncbi:hypothetical protein RvY_15191 [Ramazzottius varieornatus]|uniref:RING-type domain-containing protein n=1 Tax=Ramazzottius varieornatus TaxID=947166 RepID=A0A1D1W262_RAMVA|nr:hypothetical protein RvY_15191 [Ramazzottius varieornatus]